MKSFQFSSVTEFQKYAEVNQKQGHIVFSSVENVVGIAKGSSANTISCSTAGEYTSNGYCNGTITGFSYDLDIAEVVVIDSPPIKSLDRLKSAYHKVKNNPNAFALLLCDGLSQIEESIITTFYFAANDFKIIGGSAGDNL